MQTLLNVLVFLLILTGIIVIHELGHFVAFISGNTDQTAEF